MIGKQISKLRKRIGLILLFSIIGFSIFMTHAHSVASMKAYAQIAEDLVLVHIRERGEFPKKQVDLEASNVLRKTVTDGKPAYYIRSVAFNPLKPEDPSGWQKIPSELDLFRIAYNIKLENLTLIDNELQDKNTGQQYLLIDGPYGSKFPKYLKNTYEKISKKWFEEYNGQRDSF